MAVARAAKQRSGSGLTSAHIWMIVFVVLWLVSTVGFVIQFTYQEDLRNANDKLRGDNDRLIKQPEKGSLRQYFDRASAGKSVIGVLEKERQDTVQLITGAGGDDYTAALAKKEEVIERITGDGLVPVVSANDPLLTTLSAVYDKLREVQELLGDTQAERDELNADKSKLTEALASAEGKFTETAQALTDTVESEEKQNQQFREEKDGAVNDLQAQIAEMQDDTIRLLREKDEESDQLRSELDSVKKINAEQQARLAENRPPVDPKRVAWEADGRIVRALPGDPLVYINLGRTDNLLLGLRFQVYSPNRGPGDDGNGKATVKVVGLRDGASECQILRSTPGDPIVEGDLISNAIYDRGRKFSFVLTGGFDLDFDGLTDTEESDRIRALIKRWGGRVVGALNATTDFLVLGERPHVPTLGENPSPERRERERTARVEATVFDTLRREARDLAIPILTQAQFLAFIGYSSGTPLPLGD